METKTAKAETIPSTPSPPTAAMLHSPDSTTLPGVSVETKGGRLSEDGGGLDKEEHQRSPIPRRQHYPSNPSHETQPKIQSQTQDSPNRHHGNHHHHHHHHRHTPEKNDAGSPRTPSKQDHQIPRLPVSPKDTLSRLLPPLLSESQSPTDVQFHQSAPQLSLEKEMTTTTTTSNTTTADLTTATTNASSKGLTSSNSRSNTKSVGVYVKTALAMSKLKHHVQQQQQQQTRHPHEKDDTEEEKKETTTIAVAGVTNYTTRICTVDVDGIKVHPKDFIYSSLTRTSDLESSALEAKEPSWTLSKIENSLHDPSKKNWEAGDYVVGRYVNQKHQHVYSGPLTSVGDFIELPTGRHRYLLPGDVVVGVLGRRQATQELCGDFSLVEHPSPDGQTTLDDLDGAGLFGRTTSISSTVSRHGRFIYEGHVMRDEEHGGRKVTMNDFVVSDDDVPPVTHTPSYIPTVLVLGTSMSVGKSSVCRSLIRIIKNLLEDPSYDPGVDTNSDPPAVVGAKLTGAGYMNDLYSYSDAGASAVVDFVDAGLPSTVMPREEYRRRLHKMYGIIDSKNPSCVVIEAGASPIENYNGEVVLESFAYGSEAKNDDLSIEEREDGEIDTGSNENVLRKVKNTKTIPAHSWSSSSMSNHLTDENQVHAVPTANRRNLFVILCATDVFSVVAAKSYLRHFEIAPDLVSGIVANTKAGQELVRRLTGIAASSLNDDKSIEEFEELLDEKLDLRERRDQQQKRLNSAGGRVGKSNTVLDTCATEHSTKCGTTTVGSASSLAAPLSPREQRQLRQRQ